MSQLFALGLSLAVEIPMVTVGLRQAGLLRTGLVAAGATLLTHPVVWHATPLLTDQLGGFGAAALVTETAAVLVEGALFAGILSERASRAVVISLAANALSFTVGLVVYAWS